MTILEPVVAATVAVLVGVVGPQPAALTPRAATSCTSVDASATKEPATPYTDPAQVGRAADADCPTDVADRVGRPETDPVRSAAAIANDAIRLADRIITAITATGGLDGESITPMEPEESDDESSSDSDSEADAGDGSISDEPSDSTDPAPPATPQPVPAPHPVPSQPGPSGTAAQLQQALRELAVQLQASTDPEMQQLGADLLGVLGGAPPTAPGPMPTVPGVPTVPDGSMTPGETPSLPSVVPSGATPLFHDDFETGDLTKWGTCQGAGINGECARVSAEQGMGVVQDPQRGNVAQFSVTDGEESEVGGGRAEVRDDNNPGTLVKEGDDRWYAWSMKFPQDLPKPDGIWNIVMQWHQMGDSGSPPLDIDISKGTVDIGGGGSDGPRQTIGEIHRGEWVNYVLHVGFSRTDGFVEAWENGRQTVQRTPRATMSDEANYLKMGIYRDPDATGDAQVLFDDLTILDGAGAAPATPGAPVDPITPGGGSDSTDGPGVGSDDTDSMDSDSDDAGVDPPGSTPAMPTSPPLPGVTPAGVAVGDGRTANGSGRRPARRHTLTECGRFATGGTRAVRGSRP